jgi:hypothetical protein
MAIFNDDVDEKIDEIHDQLKEIMNNNEKCFLIESLESGKMELEVQISNPYLVIKKIEDHKLSIFKNQKCADHIVFEYVENNIWKVHILEMKRSVRISNWDHIILQFEGALRNALAINGFFEHTSIQDIQLYTVFLHDKIQPEQNPNSIELHLRPGMPLKKNAWNEKFLTILNRKLSHEKIEMEMIDDIPKGSFLI